MKIWTRLNHPLPLYTNYELGIRNYELKTNQEQFTLTATDLPWTIAPGDNQTFTVVFNPTSAGDKSEIIRVMHNATGSPTDIHVSGTGELIPPIFEINPEYHDFGSVEIGQTASPVTFTITNEGGMDLIVNSIVVAERSINRFSPALNENMDTTQPPPTPLYKL